MGKCVVKDCSSRTEKNIKWAGVTFHKVPKDHERMAIWIKNIRLLRKETDWLPTSATVICSKHFHDKHKIAPKNDKGHYRLSNDAVPMVIDETNPAEFKIDLSTETDQAIIEILESPIHNEMRKNIKHLKYVSSKRLQCIKRLRQENRRLKEKNKKLSDIIIDLKNNAK